MFDHCHLGGGFQGCWTRNVWSRLANAAMYRTAVLRKGHVVVHSRIGVGAAALPMYAAVCPCSAVHTSIFLGPRSPARVARLKPRDLYLLKIIFRLPGMALFRLKNIHYTGIIVPPDLGAARLSRTLFWCWSTMGISPVPSNQGQSTSPSQLC